MALSQLLPVAVLALVGLVRPNAAVERSTIEMDLAPLQSRSSMIISTEQMDAGDANVIVVDVGRDRREFRRSHIPGARFLDWRAIAIETPAGVDLPGIERLEQAMSDLGIGDDKQIVLYSRDILTSTWAWYVFDYLGHGHRVAVLDGGWGKWLREGRPVAGGDFVPRRSAFRSNVREAARIDLGELQARLGTISGARPYLIDARALEEYRGEVTGRSVNRAGHIPGAYSIHWMENLEVIDGVAVFRLPSSLRALYLRGRAPADSEPVVYCRTGVEASMTYFVLRSLGFHPRLYSGSYVEWSETPNLPVGRSTVDSITSSR